MSETNSLVVDFTTVAKTPSGARVLSYIINRCTPLFGPGFSGDANQDAYYNGQRSVALAIMDQLGSELFFKVVQTPVPTQTVVQTKRK